MHLIFSESMILPEVAERREDKDLEDWLTAALIENTNQPEVANVKALAPGVIDLWMLEITERTGPLWSGSFQVEFSKEDAGTATDGRILDDRTGRLSFLLNINTGELRFTSGKSMVSASREDESRETEMWIAAA
jgi:hypothetical protein